MHRLYANTMPFYIRDLSICRFWYLSRGEGPGPTPVDTKEQLYSELFERLLHHPTEFFIVSIFILLCLKVPSLLKLPTWSRMFTFAIRGFKCMNHSYFRFSVRWFQHLCHICVCVWWVLLSLGSMLFTLLFICLFFVKSWTSCAVYRDWDKYF